MSSTASPTSDRKWAFLLCFAGVGLNFDLRELARAGVRPLAVAALGLVVVAACSLGLVLLTSGWLHLAGASVSFAAGLTGTPGSETRRVRRFGTVIAALAPGFPLPAGMMSLAGRWPVPPVPRPAVRSRRRAVAGRLNIVAGPAQRFGTWSARLAR
jgi:hypothetical protein